MVKLNPPEQQSIDIILNNRYLDIATCKNKSPWVNPVYYGVDQDLTFYFISRTSTRHANFIEKNPNVALAIWDSTKLPEPSNGLQIKAESEVVSEDGLEHAVKTLFRKRFQDKEKQQEYVEDYGKYSGDSEKKLFEIRTKKLYLSGDWDRTEIDTEKVKQRLKDIDENKGLAKEHHNRI